MQVNILEEIKMELTKLALYCQRNEHPTTGKDWHHQDSNLPKHQEDQK